MDAQALSKVSRESKCDSDRAALAQPEEMVDGIGRFFEFSNDLLFISDREFRIKRANGAWSTLGYSSAELVGRCHLDFLHREDRAAFSSSAHRRGRWRDVTDRENRFVAKDGSEKWMLWSAYLVDEDVLYGRAVDVTQRKRSEHNLVRINAKLRSSESSLRNALRKLGRSHRKLQSAQLEVIQAEKLESVGTLAAGVAHEVKNPLQVVLAGIDCLAKEIPCKSAGTAAIFNDIREAIERANSVLGGLLDFATTYTPEFLQCDLNKLLEETLVLAKYELTKGQISVQKQLSLDLPPIDLDANRIKQMFLNLFLNGIQAMEAGGTLTIETVFEPKAGAQRRSQVRARVTDTGSGITPENLHRIFEPFFSTKRSGQGTGLGLTVARRIVEFHGGTLTLANKSPGGVQATVLFPTRRNYA